MNTISFHEKRRKLEKMGFFENVFKKFHFLGFTALFMERKWVHSIPREKLHLEV